MAYRVDRTMLESVFPAGDIVVLQGDALDVIPHEPTRNFLRDVGLPDESWLRVGRSFRRGELQIGFANTAARYPELDLSFERWIFLGDILNDSAAVDAATGIVYVRPDDGKPHLLSSSIDEFVYFLYLLEVERPNYDFEKFGDADDDGEEYPPFDPRAATRLRAQMTASDPEAFQTSPTTWDMVLDYVSGDLQ